MRHFDETLWWDIWWDILMEFEEIWWSVMTFHDLWYGDDVNGMALLQFWLSLVNKCRWAQEILYNIEELSTGYSCFSLNYLHSLYHIPILFVWYLILINIPLKSKLGVHKELLSLTASYSF